MTTFIIGDFIYILEVKWMPIIFQGKKTNYEVSNIGQVRNKTTKKILSPFTDKDGYQHVSITVNGKLRHRGIHRFVATAFIKNPKNKPEVNHINGNKKDNVILNLEWVTTAENVRHAFKTGLKSAVVGSNNTLSHYSDDQITMVCELLEAGVSNKKISNITGVDRKYITDIKKGRRWSHISVKYNIKKEKYPKEMQERIRELVHTHSNREVAEIMGLEKTSSHMSLINRIRQSELTAPTTIETVIRE